MIFLFGFPEFRMVISLSCFQEFVTFFSLANHVYKSVIFFN